MLDPMLEADLAYQRYQDLVRDAEWHRRLHWSEPWRPGVSARLLAGLGDTLISLGERLRARYPIPSMNS